MSDVILRAAKRSDAADLAILDNIAAHGLSAWFWQDAVKQGKAGDAYSFGRARFQDDASVYGWKNSVVAEKDGVIAGSACGYVMPEPDEDVEAVKTNAKPFVPVFELFSLAVSEWFVDSLAVYENARRQGIGSLLLDNSLKHCREKRINRASLVVEDSNGSAVALYGSRGFRERDRRRFIPFDDGHRPKQSTGC